MARHLTLPELAERRERRKREGANQTYPRHAQGTAASADAPAPRRSLPVLPCANEGRVLVPCHSCGAEDRHVRDCEIHGQVTRVECGKNVEMTCERCRCEGLGYAPKLPAGVRDWRAIEGWLSEEEATAYRKLLETVHSGTVVEIGTHYGRSAVLAATAILGRDVRLHCIDPWENEPPIESEARRNLAPFGPAVVIHKGRSPAAAATWPKNLPIACLYLDGLHEYEHVRADLDAWLPHVRPGAWVCGHDYQLEGVKRAVGERFGTGVKVAGDEYGFWWAKKPAPPPSPRPDFAVIPQPPVLELKPTSKRAVVTAVVGAECELLHAASGPHHRKYAAKIGADYVVLKWEFKPLPIAVKFQIARVLEHYDRIAFLDADTYVHPETPDLFAACAPDEFGFCPENMHHPGFMMRERYHRFRRDMDLAPVDPLPWYMNTGVMVVPSSHRHLFLPPERPMHLGHMTEQHWVGAGLLDSGLPYRFLDARFNWQNWVDPGWRIAARFPWCVYHLSGIGGTRPQRAKTIAELAERFPWPEPTTPQTDEVPK